MPGLSPPVLPALGKRGEAARDKVRGVKLIAFETAQGRGFVGGSWILDWGALVVEICTAFAELSSKPTKKVLKGEKEGGEGGSREGKERRGGREWGRRVELKKSIEEYK